MRWVVVPLLFVSLSGCVEVDEVPEWVNEQGWDELLEQANLIEESPHTIALAEANLPMSPGEPANSIDRFYVFFRSTTDDGDLTDQPDDGHVDFSLGSHEWTASFTKDDFDTPDGSDEEGSYTGSISYPEVEPGYYALRAELFKGDQHVDTARADVYMTADGNVVEAGEPKGYMGVPNGSQMVINAFTSRCNAYLTISSPDCEYHPDAGTLAGFGYTLAAHAKVEYQIHLARQPCREPFDIKPSSGDRDWVLHGQGMLDMTPENRVVDIEPIPLGAVFRVTVENDAVVGLLPGGEYYAPFVREMEFNTTDGYTGIFVFRDGQGAVMPVDFRTESYYERDPHQPEFDSSRYGTWVNQTASHGDRLDYNLCSGAYAKVGWGDDANAEIRGMAILQDGREFTFEWQD